MIEKIQTDMTVKKNKAKTNVTTKVTTENVELMTTENKKIKVSDIDLNRISTSSKRALDGEFVKVNENIWKNATNLQYIEKENGTYLIKNGNIPLGYTDKKGIKTINKGTDISKNTGSTTKNTATAAKNTATATKNTATAKKNTSTATKNKTSNTNLNSYTKNVSEALKYADVNYKNGLYYDKDKNKLLYGDEDISYLIDKGLIKFNKLPSAEIKKINNKIEINYYDNTSTIINNDFVINKDKDGQTTTVFQKSNGKLIDISGASLYDQVSKDMLNQIVAINASDLSDYYSNFVKKYRQKSNKKTEQEQSKMARYYYYINDYFGDTLSFDEKMNYSKLLKEADQNNYNNILYSTPELKNGRIKAIRTSLFNDGNYAGDYLEYYNDNTNVLVPLVTYSRNSNGDQITKQMTQSEKDKVTNLSSSYYSDIMKNSNNYSEKFKNATNSSLEDIIMFYNDDAFNNTDYNDWAAYTTPKEIDKKTEMLLKLKGVEQDEGFMLDSYTHELGHVYSIATSSTNKGKIDESADWITAYNQTRESDPYNMLLRGYAHSDSSELFAEATAEYFSSGKTGFYNSNDLKAVDIDVDGYTNLYDYMTEILT